MNKIRKNYNRIKSSKDGKTLLSNFGYLSILQIASYIFPLFTLPYLARVIGVDSFGKIAFASAIIVWFLTIVDWGFNYTATRDVAQNREDKEKVSRIFSNVFWARIFLMVLAFIILLILIWSIPVFYENKTIILITYLSIPGYIMFPDWFFQALERMKYITIMNLIAKTIFTIAVFIFIKEKSDYILQPVLVTLGSFVSGIISIYIIFKKWGYSFYKPDLKEIRIAIKGSVDVFLNNIVPNLYNSFSIVLLGFYGGNTSNGKFDAGNKFISIAQQFMNILSRTFYPFLSRRIDKHNLYVKINLAIAIIIGIGLFIVAPIIIKLFYTEEFYDGIDVLRILGLSIPFMALFNIYGVNYLIIQKKEKLLRNITIVCSLIGASLSFPLISYFDFIGAAFTILITRILLGSSIMLYAKRLKSRVAI
ncbi:MAG: flippase [Brumimicrobium sp.]|nr:flippase [Brumimicrobium sp.]